MPKLHLLTFGCLIAASTLAVNSAFGDVFVFKSGGRLEGKWLNQTGSVSSPYEVKTVSGVRLQLQRADIDEVVSQRDAEEQYERLAPQAADTVQGQWKIAEWCRENHLPKHRTAHLRRIIEIDPDHLPSRRALGYAQVGGQWLTRDEWRRQQGFEYYRGRWRMPQEIDLLEKRRSTNQAEREWTARLRTLREQLGGADALQAKAEFLAIQDPAAVSGIVELLANEPLRVINLIYVEALGNIGGSAALNALMQASIYAYDEEIRVACLDELKELDPAGLQAIYVKQLANANNVVVNRAAYALAEVGDQSAATPLIDALITSHTITIGPLPGAGPQTMTTTFATNQAKANCLPGQAPSTGSGLSMGQKPKTINRRANNPEVLTALLKITQAPNYGYDQQAWRRWLESQHDTINVNSRRD